MPRLLNDEGEEVPAKQPESVIAAAKALQKAASWGEPEGIESFETAKPVTVRAEKRGRTERNGVITGQHAPGTNGTDPEDYLIGACLLDEGPTLDKAIHAGLTTADLTNGRRITVFSALRHMREVGIPIGLDTLVTELGPRLTEAGGIVELMALADPVTIGTTLHAEHYIRVILDRANRRRLVLRTKALLEKVEAGADLEDLLPQINDLAPAIRKQAKADNAGFTVWQPAAFRAWEAPLNVNIMGGGYIRRKQLTTLIGPPGVGKSRLSLWLACLHICGRQFIGLDMQNGPAKWLFFGNENDPMRQKSDLDWFYRNLTEPERAKVDAHLFLHVLDQPDDGIITLADVDAYNKLCATLKVIQPDVVVFDPWGNMIEGNENDNEEVRRTLKFLLRAIAQNCPDAAIIVIHHARTGKATAIEAGNNYSGGNLGRGSKVLVSAARCELALWPGDSEDSMQLVLTCEKANNVQKFEPKGLTFDNGIYVENTSFDLQAWRDDIEGNRGGKTLTIRDVVEMVREGCHKSADIVARCDNDFGVQKRTVYTRLNEACDKGYLQKTVPAGSYTIGSKKLVA